MEVLWKRSVRPFGQFMAALAAALVLCGLLAVPASAQPQSPTEGPLPVPFDIRAGIAKAFAPQVPPPGANDFNCKPSAAHPRPVVLVNPTVATQATAFQAGAPLLKNAGYCVFTFNHGNVLPDPNFPLQALGDIRLSAQTLSDEVNKVLAATGAAQVDLVGHSQGAGILPDYYMKFLGGAAKVHTKVGISPSVGTTLSEFVYLRTLIPIIGPFVYNLLELVTPALIQQVIDSPLSTEVYGTHDNVTAVPGPNYYSIITQYDEVVTPFVRQFYKGSNATNVLLQDGCEADHSEHVSTLYSERAWLYVLNGLDPAHAQPVPCFYVAPFAPYVT